MSSTKAPIQEGEHEQGGIAVVEKPATKKDFEDYEKVTVLYGWNKVPPGSKQYVDKVLFKDGIARNVPYTVVKHWKRGTRPDGKNDQICGKISIQAVLPDEVPSGKNKEDGTPIMRLVDESDFARITGVDPMPVGKIMAQLAGVDLEALATQLGADRLKQLVDNLGKYLPPTKSGRK